MKSSHPPLFSSLRAALIGLAGGLCILAQVHAQQVPDRLNYQGILRKGDGTPEPAGWKNIEFRIYDAATSGNLLWARTHAVSLDTNGLFNVVLMEGGAPIASVNPRHTNLVSVFTDPGGEGRYLELTVVGSTPILPRQKFVSTAYAFLAGDVTQAKENFTVLGGLTVQNGARVNSLTVDTTSTLKDATFSGNVGIGTTSPGKTLTVNGDMEIGTRSDDYQHLRLGGGNSSGYLYGSYPPDGIHLAYNYYVDGSQVPHVHNTNGQTSKLMVGYGQILLATAGVNTAPTTRMKVDQNGNVGIGTTNPGRLLQVGDTNTPNSLGMIRLASRSGNSSARRSWDIGIPETDDYLDQLGYDFIIDDNEFGAGPEFMIDAWSGNVGIGTSKPQQLLQIGDDKTNNSTAMIRLGSRSADGNYYRAWDIGVPTTSPLNGGTGYSFLVDDTYRAGTEFMVQYNTGNVGIGTNNPSATLHVAGNLKVMKLLGAAHKDVCWLESSGEFSYDSSSRRYKENIRPLEADWFALLNAEPKTYTRPGIPGVWEIGFIAEDLDELGLKELVYYDETGRPDSIHYRKIGLYLLEIAKAQQKELADKSARVESLEKSVADLKATVELLVEKIGGGTR